MMNHNKTKIDKLEKMKKTWEKRMSQFMSTLNQIWILNNLRSQDTDRLLNYKLILKNGKYREEKVQCLKSLKKQMAEMRKVII